jgi:hypothetical protein
MPKLSPAQQQKLGEDANFDWSADLVEFFRQLPDKLGHVDPQDAQIVEQTLGSEFLREREYRRLKKVIGKERGSATRGEVNLYELDIIRMHAKGLSLTEIAKSTGSTPESVRAITREWDAVKKRQQAQDWVAIAKSMGTTPEEAKRLYARGTSRFRQNFDPSGFEPTSVTSDRNRNHPTIVAAVENVKRSLGNKYQVRTTFTADSLGGRYAINIVDANGKRVGEPFRISVTPDGQELISKEGKGPGGYRLTKEGKRGKGYNDEKRQYDFNTRLQVAVRTMAKRGSGNVTDYMGVKNQLDKEFGHYTRITADLSKMSLAGQYREEHGHPINISESVETQVPPNEYVYGRSAFPTRARLMIPGNVAEKVDSDRLNIHIRHFSSQPGLGKVIKRDNLTLTRKYDKWGPQPGTEWPKQTQHFKGLAAAEPETAYSMTAFMLAKNMLPEGQMWMDKHTAGYTWDPFERNPEKFRVIVPKGYQTQDVLASMGLLNEQGEFKPRRIKSGRILEGTPGGARYNFAGNNDFASITGYRAATVQSATGNPMTAIYFEGYTGNQTSATAAFKFQGHKHLSVSKDIRGAMGIDADMVLNRPSDSVVAMINSLNAMPRNELEGLWKEVHGHSNIPSRIGMENLGDAAQVYKTLWDKNYRDDIVIRDQLMTGEDLKKLHNAGFVIGDSVQTVAGPYAGSERMFRADLRVAGSFMPVGVNMITDVTDPKKGNLSHEALTSLEYTMPGVGVEMRRRGQPNRDIFNTIYEANRLNKNPDYKGGAPIANVFQDIKDPEFRKTLFAERDKFLQEMLPIEMARKFAANEALSPDEESTYYSLVNQAGGRAFETIYGNKFEDDAFIFHLQGNEKIGASRYLLNPKATERFGYIDEYENELVAKMAEEGRQALGQAYVAAMGLELGKNSMAGAGARNAIQAAAAASPAQEELLSGKSARKRWFGTTHKSVVTHVHASDWGVPRNAAFTSWDNIGKMFNIDTNTPEGRMTANELATRGELRFGGGRNPFSHPMLQLATVGAMLTPDIAKAMSLDLDLRSNGIIFHPEQIMRQGGDNDSDMSQIFGLSQFVEGEGVVNRFPLTAANQITMDAIRHSSGEYWDSIKKMNLEQQEALKAVMGFRPDEGPQSVVGNLTAFNEDDIATQSFWDAALNAVQIGQSYNIPIKVLQHLSKHNDPRYLISQHGGSLYQNPLDKKNYAVGTPEHKLFAFMSSYNPALKSWKLGPEWKNPPKKSETTPELYELMKDPWIWGADQITSILLEMASARPDQKNRSDLLPEEFAALVAPNMANATENLRSRRFIEDKLKGGNIEFFRSPLFLKKLASQDSPIMQMVRGVGVQNASTQAQRFYAQAFDESPTAKLPDQSVMRNYSKQLIDLGRNNSAIKTMYEDLIKDLPIPSGKNLFEFMLKKGGYETLDPGAQQNLAKKLSTAVISAWSIHPELIKMKEDLKSVRDLMGPTAEAGSQYEQTFDEFAASRSVGEFIGRKPIKLMGEGERDVDKPTPAIIGEAGPEDVVPHSKTRTLPTGEKVYDPNDLGTATYESKLGEGYSAPLNWASNPSGELSREAEKRRSEAAQAATAPAYSTIHQMTQAEMDAKLAYEAELRAGYGAPLNWASNPSGELSRRAERRRSEAAQAAAAQAAAPPAAAPPAGGGQPPVGPPITPSASPLPTGPQGPIQQERVVFSQPFTPKLAAQYELLAAKLDDYSERIEEMYQSGETVVTAEGQLADVLNASAATYPRLEDQRKRAGAVQRRWRLQEEEAKGTLTPYQERSLEHMRTLRPHDVTGTEFEIAQRISTSIGDLLQYMPGALNAKGQWVTDPSRADQSLYSMAAQVGARPTGLARQGLQDTAWLNRRDQIELQNTMAQEKVQAQVGGRAAAKALVQVSGDTEFQQVRTARSLREEAAPLYQKWSDLMQEFRTAGGARQRELAPQMNDLQVQIANLVSDSRELAPAIKANKEQFEAHRVVLEDQMATIQSWGRGTWTSMVHAQSRLQKEKLDDKSKAVIGQQLSDLQTTLGQQHQLYIRTAADVSKLKQLEKEFSVPQVTAPGLKEVQGPPTWYEKLAGRDGRPIMDEMFYKSQLLAQGYNMLGAPLMQMRQEYLQGQFTQGQAQYALGYGQMPQNVIDYQIQSANMSRLRKRVGEGVDQSYTAQALRAIAEYSSSEEGGEAAVTAGGMATDLFSLASLGMITTTGLKVGGKMISLGAKAGGLLSASKVGGFLGSLGLGGAAATALGIGGSVLGGALAGAKGYDLMHVAGQETEPWMKNLYGMAGIQAERYPEESGWSLLRKTMLTPVAAAASVGLGQLESLGGMFGVDTGWLTNAVGKGYEAVGEQGAGTTLYNMLTGQGLGLGSAGGGEEKLGRQIEISGLSPDAYNQFVNAVDQGVMQQLRDAGYDIRQSPFVEEQLSQLVKTFADITGKSGAEIRGGPLMQSLTSQLSEAVKAGVSAEDLMGIYAKIAPAFGVAPGSEAQLAISQWVQQGSLFQRQQRLEAGQAITPQADIFGLDKIQLGQIFLDTLQTTGGSYFKTQVAMERYAPQTQYGWSEIAYSSGQPQLATQSEASPWMQRGMQERWDMESQFRQIEAQRDLGVNLVTGEVGGGRQQQELDWAHERMALEEEFWDYKTSQRDSDHEMGQKQFDLQKRQMEWNIQQAQKQYEMSEKYTRRQYEINLQLFDLQTEWRYQDLAKQEQRTETQRGWQVQDEGLNRYGFELQAGWQQEDMQRNLRYSTGRQRLEIKRQMERANVMNNLQRVRMNLGEERSETQFGWQMEDIATQRERWGIQRPLEREQITMGFEQWEQQQEFQKQNIELMKENLDLYVERNTLNEEFYFKSVALEAKKHAQEVTNQAMTLVWQQQDLAYSQTKVVISERQLQLEQAVTEAQMIRAYVMAMGTEQPAAQNIEGLKEMLELMQQRAELVGVGANGEGVELPEGGDYSIYPLNNTGNSVATLLESSAKLEVLQSENNTYAKEMTVSLAAIQAALIGQSGAKIILDIEALREAGFITVQDLYDTYH